MKYGKPLKRGGTIGFAAPSFGCAQEPYASCFKSALEVFKSKGYKLDLGPNCFLSKGTGISNTPESCGRELTESYISAANDCVISCGGGELMCEILDYVDWEAVKNAPPKLFMGFSDNTNMTYTLAAMCDTASIYGPCAPGFGVTPWHGVFKKAFGMLCGNEASYSVSGFPKWESESLKTDENPLIPFNLTEKKILRCYNPCISTAEVFKGGKIPETHFEGRLLGGCMDCLRTLLGTPYDHTVEFAGKYADDGVIWFLEACDLNAFDIRRTMWQLDHAGWFKNVKGFLFGRHYSAMEPVMGLDRFDAVLDTAAKKNVPVIMDMDLGHLPPSLPLITGSYAKVTVKGNKLNINMELKE